MIPKVCCFDILYENSKFHMSSYNIINRQPRHGIAKTLCLYHRKIDSLQWLTTINQQFVQSYHKGTLKISSSKFLTFKEQILTRNIQIDSLNPSDSIYICTSILVRVNILFPMYICATLLCACTSTNFLRYKRCSVLLCRRYLYTNPSMMGGWNWPWRTMMEDAMLSQ